MGAQLFEEPAVLILFLMTQSLPAVGEVVIRYSMDQFLLHRTGVPAVQVEVPAV
jgi:hypothetical protein